MVITIPAVTHIGCEAAVGKPEVKTGTRHSLSSESSQSNGTSQAVVPGKILDAEIDGLLVASLT